MYTTTHLHLRKYQFSVVKYPRQFKLMQLEIKMQLLTMMMMMMMMINCFCGMNDRRKAF